MEHIITFSVGDLTSICDFNLGTPARPHRGRSGGGGGGGGGRGHRRASRWQEGTSVVWTSNLQSSFKLPKPLVHFQRKLIERRRISQGFQFPAIQREPCCRTAGAFTRSVRLKHTQKLESKLFHCLFVFLLVYVSEACFRSFLSFFDFFFFFFPEPERQFNPRSVSLKCGSQN